MNNNSLDYLKLFDVYNNNSLAIFDLSGIFKLLFFVVIVCYLVYAVLMALRIRILSETLTTPFNKYIAIMSFVHVTVGFVGSLLALVIILLS
jgi:hypothetical protein